MEFTGEFKAHLTLDVQTAAGVAEAARWARDEGIGFTHIELDRGTTPSQPVFSCEEHGTLSRVLDTAALYVATGLPLQVAIKRTIDAVAHAPLPLLTVPLLHAVAVSAMAMGGGMGVRFSHVDRPR
jgi:hypothetical protein